MSNYRKLWEDKYGPIPYDTSGRRMEIHHIDGDRNNNALSNLKLVTINEHYDIHHSNGDWGACQSIINRMNINPKEKSKTCSELAKKRLSDGTHHFLDPDFIKLDSIRKSTRNKGSGNPMYGKKASDKTRQKQSESQRKRVTEGTHHLLSDKHKERMQAKAIIELANGTHVFQQEKNKLKAKQAHQEMLEKKQHPFNNSNRIDPNKIKKWCDVCGKEVTLPVFGRFHKH